MFRVYLHIGNEPSFTDVSMAVLPRNGDLLEYRSTEHAEHRGVYRVLMVAVCQVVAVAIYLVRENPLRIMSFPLVEAFRNLL